MRTTLIAGGVLVVVLLIGGFIYWRTHQSTPEPVITPPVDTSPQVQTYSSSTLGITLQYPGDYSLNESYAYDQFGEKKLIHGASFTIPLTAATGTNLSSDTRISVEELPRAVNCTGDIFIPANVKAQTITEASSTYSVASTTGAGAGNFYEEIVFAIPGSKPCTAVRYFIHSTNIGNYSPGAVREYDRMSLMGMFDTIRRSLILAR